MNNMVKKIKGRLIFPFHLFGPCCICSLSMYDIFKSKLVKYGNIIKMIKD